MSLHKILHSEEFQQILRNEEKFILLKNSTACPISDEALKETEKFAGEKPDAPVYYLNVQESRELSNEIAETFQVKHESPQALLFASGGVAWNASHRNVTKNSLAEAWSS
ncbi:bacillithiol system protein YtxJ [Evansella caseinilytica]|uniref:Bacillithiol system protein YtxJ n=1 Tax=Evansella caseinilytica TaxID=1503961 RepID=A0A1H3RTY8_9BACI|nr:bacillithiol system redox-active protein YtxJ [Evansella caseinilytica]SDZ28778.1 bacillithiol system protein YtxJ [Evansella caseinilytica]